MIRPVMAYEAACDCGRDCGETLFLGARRERILIMLDMNGWKSRAGLTVSRRCEFPKAKKSRKAKR